MITSNEPETWQDLQNEVGKILEECGFTVEVEKKFETARGEVELDVYAEETVKGRKYSIACECKRWKTNIPQTVVHSFRAILDNIGVNTGYIVAIKGFQPGAYKAANHTNIKLVNWEEFQKEFCDTWVEKYLSPLIAEELDELIEYTEPIPRQWMREVPDHEVPIIRDLREKYKHFGFLMASFPTYPFSDEGLPKLPLSESLPKLTESGCNIPKEILESRGYREFLHGSLKFGKQGIIEFREVRERNNL